MLFKSSQGTVYTMSAFLQRWEILELNFKDRVAISENES